MENDGFQSDGNNQYPSQPIGQPYSTQPGGQPYPTQPGGQPYPTQPVGQPFPTQPYPSVPNYGQPPPGYGYPNGPPYNAAYQANGAAPPTQQQQQVVIVTGQPSPVYVAQAQPFVFMTGAIALSCFVFWFCGGILGLIAFILAQVASCSASEGDVGSAMRLRKASFGVSIAGIVVGIIIIAIIAGTTASKRTSSTCYYSNGIRYCT